MPAGDITHPVPDLTGYITEGQIVLSPDVHGQGIYPPVDVLGSLSRLMRKEQGKAGRGPTIPASQPSWSPPWRVPGEVRDLAELIGTGALTDTDRSYLAFADSFNSVLVDQGVDEARTLEDTLDRAWRVASELPRRELTMVSSADVETYYTEHGEGHA